MSSIDRAPRTDGAPEHILRLDAPTQIDETPPRIAQKMEAIGRLSGTIAHDFNNLLGLILSYADLMDEDLETDHPARQDLSEIRKAAQRGARLTRELLVFSRSDRVNLELIDLNDVIREFKGLLQRAAGRSDLLLDLEPELWPVRIQPGKVEQIVMNLVLNAGDALPRGGTVEVATRNRRIDRSDEQTRRVSAGNYVSLAVKDEGIGITPEIAEHIFEPFFTTKPKELGTGLGLSTINSIVSEADGHIHLDTEPGHGTRFDILLPCCLP